MTTEQEATAEILNLLPEGSPAIELINAAIGQSDNPAAAMEAVVAAWAATADHADNAQ